MKKIIGIAGSLRTGSFNTALLRAAAEVAPPGVNVEIGTIRGIPLYDGDLEKEKGVPEAAEKLKNRIADADGLLLVSPEYNNSIPGTFKNALDWLTRPPKDIGRVFGAKPVAVMGATPGMTGTRFAQTAWLPILRALGTRPFFGKQLYVAQAGDAFDDEGKLADDKLRERLTEYMARFAEFAGA